MPLSPPRRHHNPTALKNLNAAWNPIDPAPSPPVPPAPVNANVTNVILTAGGGVLVLFDRQVNIDPANPPLTWTFSSAGLQAGGANFNWVVEVIPNGSVVVGDTMYIGDADPGARTPEGGFVNGTTLGVSAG